MPAPYPRCDQSAPSCARSRSLGALEPSSLADDYTELTYGVSTGGSRLLTPVRWPICFAMSRATPTTPRPQLYLLVSNGSLEEL